MIPFKHLLPITLSRSDESFVIKKHILGYPENHLQGLYIYRDHSLCRILSFQWGNDAEAVKYFISKNYRVMDPSRFNHWFKVCFPKLVMHVSLKDLEVIFQDNPRMVQKIFDSHQLRHWDMVHNHYL